MLYLGFSLHVVSFCPVAAETFVLEPVEGAGQPATDRILVKFTGVHVCMYVHGISPFSMLWTQRQVTAWKGCFGYNLLYPPSFQGETQGWQRTELKKSSLDVSKFSVWFRASFWLTRDGWLWSMQHPKQLSWTLVLWHAPGTSGFILFQMNSTKAKITFLVHTMKSQDRPLWSA